VFLPPLPQDTPPSLTDVVQRPPTPHPTLEDVVPEVPEDARNVNLSSVINSAVEGNGTATPTAVLLSTSTPTVAAAVAAATPSPTTAPHIIAPTAAAAVMTAVVSSFDDEVTLLYDVFAILLAFFFPLATFCGVRFEALLACPGLNVWAVAFAFVVACEVGFEVSFRSRSSRAQFSCATPFSADRPCCGSLSLACDFCGSEGGDAYVLRSSSNIVEPLCLLEST